MASQEPLLGSSVHDAAQRAADLLAVLLPGPGRPGGRAALIAVLRKYGEPEPIEISAADLAELPPWEALSAWLHRYVGFAATKRALNEALMETDPNSDVLLTCRTAITTAGTTLVERAQQAGIVRPDAQFVDVVRMVGAIALVPTEDDAQKQRLLDLALDGLRYQPDAV